MCSQGHRVPNSAGNDVSFGRLAEKVRQQMVATDKNIFAAVEEEVNFQEAREVILTAINLEDHIVYDQFNMRTIVCNNTLKNLKIVLLQTLCLQQVEL